MRSFGQTVFVVATTAIITSAVTLTLAWSPPALATAASGGGQAAARIGDRTITVGDVDARWRLEDPAAHVAAAQALYEGRRQTLRKMMGELLVESAAVNTGLPAAAFTEAEVGRRVRPVTEPDVLAFYAANVDTLGGTPFDELRGRIRTTLERRARERAYGELVAELAAASSSAGVFLDPPRIEAPVTDGDPALGAPDAPVTIVAFSDFQCPFCARVEPALKALHAKFGDSVRIVWKDFPLTSIHPDAFKAAEASHCAGDQSRYWDYHDRLFANQEAMGVSELKAHAAALGIDPITFAACLDSSKYASRVQSDLDSGARAGVQATPTLFVNGRTLHGAQPLEILAGIVDEELNRVQSKGRN